MANTTYTIHTYAYMAFTINALKPYRKSWQKKSDFVYLATDEDDDDEENKTKE